jgi:hypothetical protein
VLAVYGVAIAIFGAFHMNGSVGDPYELMPMRADGIRGSLQVLEQGGPPLLSPFNNITYPKLDSTLRYTYYPLPRSDDAGIYLFVPALGRLVGSDDPQLLVRWLFIGMFACALAIFPIAFFEIFGSVLAGLVAPLLLLYKIVPGADNDIYWIQAWAALFCLPLLLALRASRIGRWRLAGIAAVMLPAGAASAMRGHAGLPALLTGLAAVLLGLRGWRRRTAGVAVVLLAYGALAVSSVAVARAERAHEVRADNMTASVAPDIAPTPNGWHVLYIGLGYLPNRWGITYDDGSAANAAVRVDTHVEYLGPEYRKIMRRLYLDIVRSDPGFVVRTYLAKTQAAFLQALDRFWPGLVLALAMLVFGPRRRRGDLALVAPALLIMLVPAVVSLPDPRRFGLGWIGATGLVSILGWAWLLARLEWLALRGGVRRDELSAAVDRLRLAVPRPRSLVRSWRAWAAVVPTLLVLALLVGPLASWAGAARRQHDMITFYTSIEAPLARQPLAAGHPVGTWDFAATGARRWLRFGVDTVERRADGIAVRTGKGRFDYQLGSPKLRLPAGTYEARCVGSVEEGGIELGLLDADSQTWLRTSNFWTGQDWPRGAVMTTRVTVDRPTTIRVILANFNAGGDSSRWLLRSLELVRIGS